MPPPFLPALGRRSGGPVGIALLAAALMPGAAFADYILRVPAGLNGGTTALSAFDSANAPLPLGYTFGNVTVPEPASGYVRVKNTGEASTILSEVLLTGDPQVSIVGGADSCQPSAPLPAEGSCLVHLAFTPEAAQVYAAQLQVTGSGGARLVLPISGAGVTAAALNAFTIDGQPLAGAVSFGALPIGQAYPGNGWVGVITNTGGSTAQLQSRAISGNAAFTVNTNGPSPNCAAVTTLQPGGSCNVYAGFQPQSAGDLLGSYVITTSSGQTASIGLTGTGLAPASVSLSETQVNFGTNPVGTPVSRTVSLTNNGDLPGAVSFGAVSAPYALSEDCPAQLEADASCTLTLSFTPAAPGTATPATFNVTVGGSTQAVTLAGSGEAMLLSRLRTLWDGAVGTLPSTLTTGSPIAVLLDADSGAFLATGQTSGWGSTLTIQRWDGARFTGTNLKGYNSVPSELMGVYAAVKGPAGYVVAGTGNYNMTSSFRISVLRDNVALQTSAVSSFNYTTITGANSAVVALLRKPGVAGSYYAILSPGALGGKRWLEFTVASDGTIGNVTAHGSRASGEPALSGQAHSAVVGNDGAVYLAGTSLYAGATGVLRLDLVTGALQTMYPSAYGAYTLRNGLGVDGQGNLYAATAQSQLLRASWDGTAYGTLGPAAGKLGAAGMVDGDFGTNMLASDFLVGTGPNGSIAVLHPGSGGSRGFYRLLE